MLRLYMNGGNYFNDAPIRPEILQVSGRNFF